eukprot:699056-Alexandrium_andersonii.AAC.1
MASKLASEALEGCGACHFSRKCRISRRSGPAGAPEAHLVVSRGGDPPRRLLIITSIIPLR